MPAFIIKAIRAFLVVPMLLCFSNFLQAQEFNAAAHLGISAHQFDGDAIMGFNKLGLRGGIKIDREVSEKLDWYFGMNYHQKGARKDYRQNNQNNNLDTGPFSKLSLHYIDVPIGINFQQANKFNLLIAGSFNYLINYRVINEPGKVANINLKPFEIAVNAGFEVPLSEYWSADMLFHYSLFSVAKGPWVLPSFNTVTRLGQFNNGISLNLNYHFNRKFDVD